MNIKLQFPDIIVPLMALFRALFYGEYADFSIQENQDLNGFNLKINIST